MEKIIPIHKINLIKSENYFYNHMTNNNFTVINNNKYNIDSDDNMTIYFQNNVSFNINKSLVQKYKKLSENIINGSSYYFGKYILDIMNYRPIVISSEDKRSEFKNLLRELKFLEINLTFDQACELSDSSGFTRLMHRVREYISHNENSQCVCKNGYKKKMRQFGILWDKYIRVMSIKYSDKSLENLRFKILLETTTDNDYPLLIEINIEHNNILYDFFYWFNSFIIDNQPSEFINYEVSIEKNINEINNLPNINSLLLYDNKNFISKDKIKNKIIMINSI